MSTMESFYASLTSASKVEDAYLKALDALTKINPRQMATLASVPGWQDWSAPSSNVAET